MHTFQHTHFFIDKILFQWFSFWTLKHPKLKSVRQQIQLHDAKISIHQLHISTGVLTAHPLCFLHLFQKKGLDPKSNQLTKYTNTIHSQYCKTIHAS